MAANRCEKEILRLNRLLEKPISQEKRRKVARKLNQEWQKLYKYYGSDHAGLRRAVKSISKAENMAVKKEFHRQRGDIYD
jgi:hypothetical protein